MFVSMPLFSWGSSRCRHLTAYFTIFFYFNFTNTAALPQAPEINRGLSINTPSNYLPSSIVGLKCLSDPVMPSHLEWSKCYKVIDEMKRSEAYIIQKSTWLSEAGEGAKYIWGSKSKVGCAISISATRPGLVGHFALVDVFPAMKKLMLDCPYQPGIAYFRTDSLGADYEDGWAVTFFEPFIPTVIGR